MKPHFDKPRILLSYFEPFLNRTQNQSEVFVRKLEDYLKEAQIDYDTISLPVVYNKAFDTLKEHTENNPEYAWVISFGEGSNEVHWEDHANNLNDSDNPDNENQVFENQCILNDKGAKTILFVPQSSAFVEHNDWVFKSFKMGNYVCNNTAFLSSHYYKEQLVPYSFCHIPNEKRELHRFQDSLVPIVYQVIIDGLNELLS